MRGEYIAAMVSAVAVDFEIDGFDSSSGVEISYALPLKPGFDFKMAIDFGSWDANFHENWVPKNGRSSKSSTPGISDVSVSGS